MKLSIIIPAHNEEKTIGQTINQVMAINILPWEKEIIAVNDGSGDRTAEVLKSSASFFSGRKETMRVIHHQKNLGKGAAIRTALEKVTGDYVIIQDADLEYQPEDIPKLLSLIINPHLSAEGRHLLPSAVAPPSLKLRRASKAMADKEGEGEKQIAVFGARGTRHYPERGLHYALGAKILTLVFDLLFFSSISDLYVGYKLIPAKVFKSLNIKSTGFEFEAEIACKLRKQGIKILETPIHYYPRSKIQGKHLRPKDGIIGLWTILKFRIK